MTFSLFMTKTFAFLLSFFVTLVPFKGFADGWFEAKEPDSVKLNAALVSDVHIDPYAPWRTTYFLTALHNLQTADTKVDVMLSDGDITNYADYDSLIEYYNAIEKRATFPVITVAGNHDIGHAGDRNVVTYSREDAKNNFIYYHNLYTGDNLTTTYWSQEINGYKFIVLGDEVINGGHWDGMTMSKTQIDWLESELDSVTDGTPVFVCCHWPADGTTGERIIWTGSGIDFEENPIREILESHTNVVYISGHMHGGVRAAAVGNYFEIPMAEKVNGVIYLSLPTFGIVNQYGLPWAGTGAMMEVYEDRIEFRPVNFCDHNWYETAAYTLFFD